MDSGATLRRWAPLLAVIAVQAVLVAVVPSRGTSVDTLGGPRRVRAA